VHAARGVLICRSEYQLTMEPVLREQTQKKLRSRSTKDQGRVACYIYSTYIITTELHTSNNSTRLHLNVISCFQHVPHLCIAVQYSIKFQRHTASTARAQTRVLQQDTRTAAQIALREYFPQSSDCKVSPTCDGFHQLASQYYFPTPI